MTIVIESIPADCCCRPSGTGTGTHYDCICLGIERYCFMFPGGVVADPPYSPGPPFPASGPYFLEPAGGFLAGCLYSQPVINQFQTAELMLGDPSFTSTYTLRLVLTTSPGSEISALYSISAGAWSCVTGGTFTLVPGSETFSHGWPPTITVMERQQCLQTGTGTGTGSGSATDFTCDFGSQEAVTFSYALDIHPPNPELSNGTCVECRVFGSFLMQFLSFPSCCWQSGGEGTAACGGTFKAFLKYVPAEGLWYAWVGPVGGFGDCNNLGAAWASWTCVDTDFVGNGISNFTLASGNSFCVWPTTINVRSL